MDYLQKNTLLCILFLPHIVLSQTIAVAWVVGAAEGAAVDDTVGGAEGDTEGSVVAAAVGAAVAVLTKS